MFRIAHISDLHLPPLPSVSVRSLMSKRLLGYLSWQRKRRFDHLQRVLDALEDDLAEAAPDHLCITGDLTNITLPGEVDNATAWLEQRGDPSRVSLIPGNHDAYVDGAIDYALDRWARWMRDDDGGAGFPYLHRRGPVDIVGLSSAVASLPTLSGGRLGLDQIERCERLLRERRSVGRPCLLLIHHPPHDGACSQRRALWDRKAFREILSRSHGVAAVLFGHLHIPVRAQLQGGDGPIAALGAGAATAIGRKKVPAHYHLIDIDEQQGEARAMIIRHRHYNLYHGRFVDGEEHPV